MIDNKLIERALALTGKTMEDMEEYSVLVDWRWSVCDWEFEFSIEKFCYYLLSHEFIKEYRSIKKDYFYEESVVEKFWKAIYKYQSWNEQPLSSLLEKIWD